MKVKPEIRNPKSERSPKLEIRNQADSVFGLSSDFGFRISGFSAPSRVRRTSAISLVECLAYIAVFFVVLGVAFAAYYRMDEQSRGFTRNSTDIVQAMQAGERWRADVREATNALQLETNQELRFTTRSGDISYFFHEAKVWRQGTNDTRSTPILSNVKSSAMKADARQRVKAWRWEVELQTKRANATVRPLFTFLAVPATEVAR